MKIATGILLLLAAAFAGPEPFAGRVAGGFDGPVAGSCVETYSTDALARRSFAFAGTVDELRRAGDAELVTFRVSRWFKGGAGDRVTVRAYGFGRPTSAGGGPARTGDRMLVSGEEDMLWACGFTRPWTPADARAWASAFR